MFRRAFSLLELILAVAVVCVLTALTVPSFGIGRVMLHRAGCLSNERQIGLALLTYAQEHDGVLPPSTHTTGRRYINQSWIYQLEEYIGNFDKVRVCPAEPLARRKQILAMHATSYVLNEMVVDDDTYSQTRRLARPADTLLLFILAENRNPSQTWDHAHTTEWTSWSRAINDVEVDRHRSGPRAASRLVGSSNYLYADGHVENLTAKDFQARFANGVNPAAVPSAE